MAGVDYGFKFTNAFADLELPKYHTDRVYCVQSRTVSPYTIKSTLFCDNPLRSPQRERPISPAFMSLQRLTTERILSAFGRVIIVLNSTTLLMLISYMLKCL